MCCRNHTTNAAFYDGKQRPSTSNQHAQLIGAATSCQSASLATAAMLKRSLSGVSQLSTMEEHSVDCDAQVAADYEVAQLMDEAILADDPKYVARYLYIS
jgi:hypothetical protein